VVNSCFPTQIRHLLLVFAAAARSNRLDAAPILFENVLEFEVAFPYFLCHFCLEYKEICPPSGVVNECEEISRFAKRNRVDTSADVAVDEIARFFSSSYWRIAVIANLRSGDAGLAGIPLMGKRFRIDRHAVDEFFDI